jgi:hypothetical protein
VTEHAKYRMKSAANGLCARRRARHTESLCCLPRHAKANPALRHAALRCAATPPTSGTGTVIVLHACAGHFDILSTGDVPVMAFRLKPLGKDRGYDEFDIMHRLQEHQWMVPAYKMAPQAS